MDLYKGHRAWIPIHLLERQLSHGSDSASMNPKLWEDFRKVTPKGQMSLVWAFCRTSEGARAAPNVSNRAFDTLVLWIARLPPNDRLGVKFTAVSCKAKSLEFARQRKANASQVLPCDHDENVHMASRKLIQDAWTKLKHQIKSQLRISSRW